MESFISSVADITGTGAEEFLEITRYIAGTTEYEVVKVPLADLTAGQLTTLSDFCAILRTEIV